MNTIRDKIPVETLLRQFIDETQEIEVTRVEKTLNTTAKPLEPIKNDTPVQSIENTMQVSQPPQIPQIPQIQIPQIPQIQPIQSRSNETFQKEPESFSNSNYEQSPSNFVGRKPSISFNPEPSILEIENNSNIKLDNFNDFNELNDAEPINLSFEDLDTPVKLDFEEL